MEPAGLTPRQRQTQDFIEAYLAAHGYSPSFDEIGEHLGIRKGNVHRLVHELEERGHIRLIPGRPRSITLCGAPYGAPADLTAAWARASATEREAFLDHVMSERERRAA